MVDQLTPKQVARAAGVSESSIKRWCDEGRIETTRTAGGHRRILLSSALDFLRSTGRELVEPSVLGLPAVTGKGERTLGKARDRMVAALEAGDDLVCRQVVFELMLAGHRLATIFDDVIAESFRAIGRKWDCGEVEVYQERRGCEICMRVLHEIRRNLLSLSSSAPLAMGAAPAGDHYTLPTTMVELVLRDAGWRAVSLGSDLPFETLQAAVAEHRPRLFWLSVTHLVDPQAFLTRYGEFAESCGSQTAVVVGGRALDETLRSKMKFAAHCFNLAQLEAFASAIKPAQPAVA